MSVTELTGARTASEDRVQRSYVIDGEVGEDAARIALLAEAPTSVTIGGSVIPRQDGDAEVLETEVLDVFEGTVVWAKGGSAPGTGDSFGFRIGGQQTHLTHSIATQDSVGGLDYQGAMNVRPDGTVAGVDILVPAVTFTMTRTKTSAQLTPTYKRTLSLLVGKVNSDVFEGYQPGELLLSDVSGQQADTGEDIRLTFSFSALENKTGIVIVPGEGGDPDLTVDKKGHEYLWVQYADKLAGGIVVQRPIAGFVEQVYEAAAYSGLGI